MGDPKAFKTTLNPWQPEQNKLILALLGKHIEELAECAAMSARCVIQGIDEHEPVTGALNREELENELADVMATTYMLVNRLNLNRTRMEDRKWAKTRHLGTWHHNLENEIANPVCERIYKRVVEESPFVEKSSYTLETLKRILEEELR